MKKDLNFKNYLDELDKMFSIIIKKEFNVINARFVEKFENIPNKYGYTLKEKTVHYSIERYKNIDPIKWGFIGDTLIHNNDDDMSVTYIVPDKELMYPIIEKSFLEFEAYVHATLAKMTLLGFSTIFYPISKNYNDNDNLILNYHWIVDDSCLSPKGNCISHILLYPVFDVGKENPNIYK